MKQLLLILLISIYSINGFSESINHFCFTGHIKEAIELNKQRKTIYAQWSDGKSLSVSNKLIRLEMLTSLFSRILDLGALQFQNQGLSILCDEFVSMHNTPHLQTSIVPPQIKFSEVIKPNYKKIKKVIKELVKNNQFEEAIIMLEVELEHYKTLPYYCMYKHLLESLIRSIALMPKYQMWDQKMGLHYSSQSALTYSKNVFYFQLLGLGQGITLDNKAHVVQEMGIKIICQDTPPIPKI